jgi:N-acetylglucosaminyldiphosphoundecaprenol N-acetyl-beta-D-mannosaminyltransferase
LKPKNILPIMSQNSSITVLGYKIFIGNLDYFTSSLSGVVATLNPHSWVIARNDLIFRQALQSADCLIPDGVGMKYATRIIKGKRIKKIAGSDLHELVLNNLAEKGGSCFYLGSSRETLTMVRQRIAMERPILRVGIYSPPFREVFTEEESKQMIHAVNSFSPDVLFVGMTAPKQEKWVHANRERLKVPLICSVGAVFDFYAGTVKRPGKFWINAGLEWLPRLLREPRRLWKRNLISTPLFLYFVLVEKVRTVLRINRNFDD